MDRLTPKARAFLDSMAIWTESGSADGKSASPAADPTTPASKEEREYWEKFDENMVSVVEAMSGPIDKEKLLESTELFTFPSHDGAYGIESRFFRAGEGAPLIIHFHGGGMTFGRRDQGFEVQICSTLNKMGCSVLTPEFRNACKYHYPAGVNDCLDTVKWAHDNKATLGFGDVVITSGLSGGGNLALATFIRAIETLGVEEARSLIHGIYADAPNIRNAYVGIPKLAMMFSPLTTPETIQPICDNYTSCPQDAKSPSAWPLLATDEMLKNFPPTCLRGEEFDVLCEDARQLYGRLADLGVEGCTFAERKNMFHCQWAMGACHLGDVDTFLAIGEIAQFAKSLAVMKSLNVGTK